MDQPNYHVLLDGRTVGPYDRKTIVGMRIKHILTGDHLLVAADGTRLTVRELVGGARPAAGARGTAALPASFTGILVEAGWGGVAIPRFKGEMEVRVHADRLRLSGRRRRRFGWQEERIKIPMAEVVHARASGARLDVWLRRGGSGRLQRLGLHMFTPESAQEVLGCLPPAVSDPDQPAAALARAAAAGPPVPGARAMAVAILGVSLVIALVLLVLIAPRSY